MKKCLIAIVLLIGVLSCKTDRAEIEKENRKMRDTTFVIAVFDTLFTCCNLHLDVEYIGK